MGILVICSYKPRPGQDAEARRLMTEHVPLLRKHDLITARPVMQGEGKDGALVEIFEWDSREKSASAPHIPEIGAHWKAMAAAMEFVPLATLSEAQREFAHFTPL
ncbi:MAG: hypothetical protein J0I19_14940 [Alphaproteobacteria bacterium]|mgnify:CR=1 FL=1|nr:hypothetical protein [Alphaproteobacteria bacterium]